MVTFLTIVTLLGPFNTEYSMQESRIYLVYSAINGSFDLGLFDYGDRGNNYCAKPL